MKRGSPIHPGTVLRDEFLAPRGMTQVELAERLGVSLQRVNELVRGKRGLTPDTALRLERLFGVDARQWLDLQLTWDLHQAAQGPTAKAIGAIAPVDDMAAGVRSAISGPRIVRDTAPPGGAAAAGATGMPAGTR